MNKFIALAFFALCATMAHGQIISNIAPYGLPIVSELSSLQSGGSSSSSSAAAASSSSSSANNGLIQSSRLNSWNVPLVGAPLSALPLNAYPYGPYGPLAGPYGTVLPQGWVGPYGPVAPLAPGVVQVL